MEEIWKDIKGYEGLYQVSNFGRVKSLDKTIKTKRYTRLMKGKMFKVRLDCRGYPVTELVKNGFRKTFKIHRLVALNFIPINQPEKLTVNHIDSNKKNNKPENLEWCTLEQNMKHAYENKLKFRKYSDETIKEIRDLYKNTSLTQKEIGNIYGINKSYIGSIVRNQRRS